MKSSRPQIDLGRHLATVAAAQLHLASGRVDRVVGLAVESVGPRVSVGEEITITSHGRSLVGEVVGFSGRRVKAATLDTPVGIQPGDRLVASGRHPGLPMGPAVLGRVLDATGRPLDGKAAPVAACRVALQASPPEAMSRTAIAEPFITGVRSIDGLITCGVGQRLGIFAGSGVGKSALLGMMARHAVADVNVIALVGERGRELREFIDHDLGAAGLARSVVFVSTSDEPPLRRIRAAQAATAAAEFFRDRGQRVLLMMDSLTRVAMAQREIGLAAGEPPSAKGYTPSVFSLLPRLLERAGTSPRGSITGLYTVLVEGDDMNEPIADAARALLDGHVILSRDLASRGHYPAVDVLHSVSRLMGRVVSVEHRRLAIRARRLLATWRDHEDFISTGAYAPGSRDDVDEAIAARDGLNHFLVQGIEEPADLAATVAGLTRAAAVPARAVPAGVVPAGPST